MPQNFMRHVAACNNAALPGGRVPLVMPGGQIGWVEPAVTAALGLRWLPDGGNLAIVEGELAALGERAAAKGLCGWRNEAFDVRATPRGPVLGTIDRDALPLLGIMATGVHLNGLVRRADGLHLWVARRAMDKKLDPGKLDQIVGGGVPAGLNARQTLLKEAAEEAGMPPGLLAGAKHCGIIHYMMQRPEGLRRDYLHCYDLYLPEGFTPRPVDNEVAGFELWPIQRALEEVRDTDNFKFNVNLVLIDLFLRLGLIDDQELSDAMAG